MAVALMIARLAARWFGDRIGRLAGLLQLSFSYVILQAKLSEADMCLVAMVCLALCAFARGVIESPFGKDTTWQNRLKFWLACGAAFLLKGPIGLVFVLLTVVTFLIVRRRNGERDWEPLRWLANPGGIVCFVVLVVIWPLLALHFDPTIARVWRSEMAGTANGQFDSEPFYYYLGSVPVVLLPWTPLVFIGLWRGPNMELAGKLVSQADRAMLWRFLLCWFIPGVIFLSLAMKMKHHHYPMPVLPPLTIPAALGLDYYVRRQMSRPQGLVWPWFLAGCIAAGAIVYAVPGIPADFKPPILRMIAIFAVGGLAYLRFERLRRPGLMVAACFLTLWAAAVGEQTWLMPVQDDYRYQADFARSANGLVPPGVPIYMLGHREEEQEAEYAYYLRFPMQRLQSAEDFKQIVAKQNAPAYAIAPAGFLPELSGIGQIQTLSQCTGLRPRETESDRFELLRVIPAASDDSPRAKNQNAPATQ